MSISGSVDALDIGNRDLIGIFRRVFLLNSKLSFFSYGHSPKQACVEKYKETHNQSTKIIISGEARSRELIREISDCFSRRRTTKKGKAPGL